MKSQGWRFRWNFLSTFFLWYLQSLRVSYKLWPFKWKLWSGTTSRSWKGILSSFLILHVHYSERKKTFKKVQDYTESSLLLTITYPPVPEPHWSELFWQHAWQFLLSGWAKEVTGVVRSIIAETVLQPYQINGLCEQMLRSYIVYKNKNENETKNKSKQAFLTASYYNVTSKNHTEPERLIATVVRDWFICVCLFKLLWNRFTSE